MRFIVLLLLILCSFNVFGQKKKKQAYDDYWKEQEQLENFDKYSSQAHHYFQQGKLELAKSEYEKALQYKPKDQKTLAKIQDITILLEKQEESAKLQLAPEVKTEPKREPEPVVESKKEVEVNKNEVVTKEAPIVQPKAEPASQIEPKVVDTISSSPVPVNTTTSSAPEPEPKAGTTKPYKNTENYRKYLAQMNPSGWTEEVVEEQNKVITTRIYVEGNYGDEYKMVKHHYGAQFYFKNGSSISYSTWVAETASYKP